MSFDPLQNNLKELFNAIHDGDAALAVALQQKHKDMAIRNKEGNSPLHYAVLLKKTDIAKKLLVDGAAEIDARGWQLTTPLLFAAHLQEEAFAVFLVEHGADIRARDKWDRTVFDRARENKLDLLKAVLWKKCTPEEIARELAVAFAAGSADDFIQLVENHGADIYGKLSSGKSIATAVREAGDSAIGEFIRKKEGFTAAERLRLPTTQPVRVLRPLSYTKKEN